MTPADEGGQDGTAPRRLVYRLDDAGARDAVLEDFFTAAMGGVRALGIEAEDGPRIVVRCRTEGDAVLVDHVVRQLAPTAVAVSGQAPAQEPRGAARGPNVLTSRSGEEQTP